VLAAILPTKRTRVWGGGEERLSRDGPSSKHPRGVGPQRSKNARALALAHKLAKTKSV